MALIIGLPGNDLLEGTLLSDTIIGLGGDDVLSGAQGNDTLDGGAGDDTLDGGAGGDSMVGGAGNDVYRMDSASDTIVEAAGEGSDSVFTRVSLALPNNVEAAFYIGASAGSIVGNNLDNLIVGSEFDDTLLGGAGDDALDGGAGNDSLDGNAGNDTLVGGSGDDALYGSSGNDSLSGGAGRDTLHGGVGIDHMTGGIGNDVYYVDNPADLVAETANGGADAVFTSVTLTMADHVEDAHYIGSAEGGIFGNALANVIIGNEFANTLAGGSGDDRIDGGGGADTLDGGNGSDTLYGGSGEDLYHVDSALDVVIETSNADAAVLAHGEKGETAVRRAALEGFLDTVIAAVNYSLANVAFVENLTLNGAAAVGAGNELDNVLTGNALNNTFAGLKGDDTLDGGIGVDTSAYDGERSNYAIERNLDGTITVADQRAAGDGSDTLASVERLQFSDINLAFDLGAGEAAGNTVRIIGAAFGGENVAAHPDWVGAGLAFFQSGISAPAVCEIVIDVLGHPGNDAFVSAVYENIVGAPPSAAERDLYVGLLAGSGGPMTQAELLMFAANTEANALNIDLAGLQQSGVEFT